MQFPALRTLAERPGAKVRQMRYDHRIERVCVDFALHHRVRQGSIRCERNPSLADQEFNLLVLVNQADDNQTALRRNLRIGLEGLHGPRDFDRSWRTFAACGRSQRTFPGHTARVQPCHQYSRR